MPSLMRVILSLLLFMPVTAMAQTPQPDLGPPMSVTLPAKLWPTIIDGLGELKAKQSYYAISLISSQLALKKPGPVSKATSQNEAEREAAARAANKAAHEKAEAEAKKAPP